MPTLRLPDGARIAFGDAGAGPALVLVHGSPAEGRAWGRVARYLGGFRMLTPDLPGHGGSDALADGSGTAAMARAVAAVIDAAQEPVWLVGHSYGGNVALHAALASPARVRGLVLFEPVFFRALALAGERTLLDAATGHFTDYVRRVEKGEHAAVERMITFWFGAGAFERLPPPVRAYLENAAPRNAEDVKAALAERMPAAALAALDLPVLIGYGAGSPPVVPAIARALAGLLPEAATAAIAGATHAMLDTHPGAVADLIKSYALR